MQAATLTAAPAQGAARPRRWPTHISRFAGALFVLLYLFVHPLCYCPRYYLELSGIGLVPVIFGPRLYRYLGVAIVLTGLLSAEADRRSAIREREQIREIRAQADAQALHEHPELQNHHSSP
jgi:hypothetical protein